MKLYARVGSIIAALIIPFALSTGSAVAAQTMWIKCSGFNDCQSKGYADYQYERNGYTGQHNCAEYVAYRLELAGKERGRVHGNARDWGYRAREAGYTVNSNPRVGAIAWWHENGESHIAVVERVYSGGGVLVSEDNWNRNFGWRSINVHSSYFPDGFIHFPRKTTPQPSTPDHQPAPAPQPPRQPAPVQAPAPEADDNTSSNWLAALLGGGRDNDPAPAETTPNNWLMALFGFGR